MTADREGFERAISAHPDDYDLRLDKIVAFG